MIFKGFYVIGTQAQYLALKASAGSGKTFSLAQRFIYLLFCGANANQILTLTFTKKASNEMRHRIYKQLHTLFLNFQHGNYKENIVYQNLIEKGISHEVISNNINRIYHEFLSSNPRIATIDSFFYAVLKKFCWYVGVSTHFNIGKIDDFNINETFLQSLCADDIDNLVDFCFFHKTKLEYLLDFLSEISLLPSQDVRQVFMDSAKQVSLSFEEIDIGIKSRMQSIYSHISNFRESENLAKYFCNASAKSILDSGANYLFEWDNHKNLKKYNLCSLNGVRQEIFDLMRSYFIKKESDMLCLLQKYLTTFNQARQRCSYIENILSFSDVMLKNYELFTLNQDKDFFYFRLDERIEHILLDEFQDTSLTQYQILSPLISEIRSGEGRIGDRSLFIVGDEKQSIYMFRGSFSDIFDNATKSLEKDNLPHNYRSSPRLIDFNNKVFDKCYKQYVPSIYPNKDTNMPNGFVRVLEQVSEADDVKAQVYDELTALLKSGADENDIVILVFKNNDASLLKEYINMQNPHINVITESSASLFTKREVRFLINALEYLRLYFEFNANATESKQVDALISGDMKVRVKRMCKLLGNAYEDSKYILDELNLLASSQNTLQDMVLTLIEKFDIASSVAMRFLELSCEYADINDFLESLSGISCDAPTQSNNGIKIMTVHKSKGLEFKYVILCDKLSGTQSDKNKFICAYNGVHVEHIYYKMRKRDKFDNVYANALNEYNHRLLQEKYNQLYVAFTRAQYGLSITQKEKGAFEILSLDNLETTCDEITILNSKNTFSTEAAEPVNVLADMQYFGRQSAFVRHEALQDIDILDKQQWRNIIFGYAIHSAFELHLSFGMDSESIQHILCNRYGFALTKESLSQATKYAMNCVCNKMFYALKTNKNVACEVSYIIDGCLYRIDAILYNNEECVVLDYKSSDKQKDIQEEQVRGYMKFLDSVYGGERNIRGFIVYPLKAESEQFCEVCL